MLLKKSKLSFKVTQLRLRSSYIMGYKELLEVTQ